MTKENLPIEQKTDLLDIINNSENLALALIFNNALFTRCQTIAQMMSDAVGFTPKHLVGKKEACFSVVTRSILWKLDPYLVAHATFDVKGKFGYAGALCKAILEKSNAFDKKLRYEKIPSADAWQQVQGKFKMDDSKKQQNDHGEPAKYAKATYTEKDEEGLGVRIHYKLKGQEEGYYDYYLRQANPRFSTLWATDPWTQLCYLATRRFANLEVPEVFYGVPFDDDVHSQDSIIDVTPEKQRRTADDFNSALQKKKPTQETAVVDIPKKADTAEPRTPANEEVSSSEPHAAEALALRIMGDISKSSKEKAQAIFDEEYPHIMMMPVEMQNRIAEALRKVQ